MRWKKITKAATILALVFSVVGALFSVSIVLLPLTPFADHGNKKNNFHSLGSGVISHEQAQRLFLARRSRNKLLQQIVREKGPKLHPRSQGEPCSVVVGFYVNWDESSFESLRRHLDDLTYVMPEWLYISAKGNGTSFGSRFDPKTSDPEVIKLAAAHKLPIIPMLQNLDKDKWQWEPLRELLSNHSAQLKLAANLRNYLVSHHFGGINIDFEPPADLPPSVAVQARKLFHNELPNFIRVLRNAFKSSKLLVTEDVPANDNGFNYGALADANDLVIVMLYDEHWQTGSPGPIAGQDWIEKMAELVFARMDSSKVVLGIGNYCFDWPITIDSSRVIDSYKPAAKLNMSEALRIADDVGTNMDMDDLNPYFTYADDHGKDHIVYMLDAITAYNEIMALKGYEPRGTALWYLGSEDPSIWTFFNERDLGKPARKGALKNIVYNGQCIFDPESKGEILEIVSQPRAGLRQLVRDSDGIVRSEKYKEYPSTFLIRRTGAAYKKIALTFDDGPDRVNTPAILDILRENHVPATFFVKGNEADDNEDIVRRCWDQGCEIGNHTYTHPHIADVSSMRAELEVNATQRLIESITGHSTRLFRPPFGQGADINVGSKEDEIVVRMQKLGYVTVGFGIDTKDFTHTSASAIVARVLKQLNTGNIILMHDGGGNRAETILALPQIIQELMARGYQLVTVSQLLGPNARDSLFPPVSHRQEAIVGLDRALFETSYAFDRTMRIVFIVSILLGVIRVLLTAPLAIMHSRRTRKMRFRDDYKLSVTVAIPAYNEGKVINRTIQSVLASDYPNLHIIVVDDGSTDDTLDAVNAEYGVDPRVTVTTKANGGKASALNVAFSMADSEIVVCMDADTIFAKDTVSCLVRHFADPKVGAVAGNIKVGNRLNPLTVWQSVEYITCQNFDRRAYAEFDSVPVIPGAVGAWRKSAVEQAGGYESNTLAEDADLTFRVRLLGYSTQAENDALAYTEAPDSVSSLAKQRFRWAFGIIQALWKHKRQLFHPQYGAFGLLVMPAMWLFNIVFQVVAPVIDIMAIIAVASGDISVVVIYWAALFLLDFASCVVAFKLDNEDLGQLMWLFWQRFFYRQFMYYMIIKAILAAFRGHHVGWSKLQRKATAQSIIKS